MTSNLSKTFKYVNDNGDSITFDYPHGYLISKPDGIDTVSVTVNTAQGINQTGSTVQSVNVESRPVTITGRLCGDFQSDNKDTLLKVIRPDLGGKLYCDDMYLTVYPTQTPAIEPRDKFAGFQFSLLAAYPYWQKDENAHASLSGIKKKFKFPWNVSGSYRFGEVSREQFITIVNRGQVPIPFTVEFGANAQVINPCLIDSTTNKYLKVKKTMVAGERIVVEITHQRINCTSSVDGECRGAIDLSSKFNRLAIGDNVLKPDADSGKDNMVVDIDYSLEYVGVAV